MKPQSSSKPFPRNRAEIEAALERAPATTTDPNTPYDAGDAAAVETFWSAATVRRPGQRGPGRQPKKVLVSVRYSPEVVDYFRASGEGWQTRMDEALKDWIAGRRSA